MLKWTASAQKLAPDISATPHTTNLTPAASRATPRLRKPRAHKRYATVGNKENILLLTSTPVAKRTRNSPLMLGPLADILNVTPEHLHTRTPDRRRASVHAFSDTSSAVTRRHSSAGFTIPPIPQYAATLPKYEEEYSPSNILPTGQQLALRGLLPDPFMGNPRYFTSLQGIEDEKGAVKPKKRKLEQEFVAIAKEQQLATNKRDLNHTGLTSNKMGDQTLDNLIDAILDSARKDEKKKKPRRSFNLRRRTLLKTQVEQHEDLILSPSYAAGDDPCSDLSFLNCDRLSSHTTKSLINAAPVTPPPATPPPGTPLSHKELLQLPTPGQGNDSFALATPAPAHSHSQLKRRSESSSRREKHAKKCKVDRRNYFEIGLALPSIYV